MNISIVHNNPLPPTRKNLIGGELFAYSRYPDTVWLAGTMDCPGFEIKDVSPGTGVVVKVYDDEINSEVLVYGRIQVNNNYA